MNYGFSLSIALVMLVLWLLYRFKKWDYPVGIVIAIDDYGIELTVHKDRKRFLWSQIQSIVGYKQDAVTIDHIILELYANDEYFLMHDETPGFSDLVPSLGNHLELPNQNWFVDLALPPFETNLTLIYDHKNRTLLEVLNERSEKEKKKS